MQSTFLDHISNFFFQNDKEQNVTSVSKDLLPPFCSPMLSRPALLPKVSCGLGSLIPGSVGEGRVRVGGAFIHKQK